MIPVWYTRFAAFPFRGVFGAPGASPWPGASPFQATESLLLDQPSSQYVRVGDVYDPQFDQAMSISAWIKPDSTATPNIVASKQNNDADRRGFVASAFGGVDPFPIFWQPARNSLGARIAVQTATTYPSGSWIHVIWTYDGSATAAGARIYVNGGEPARGATTDTLTTQDCSSAADFIIGAGRDGTASYFDGNVRDVAIWYGTVLDAGQRAEVYNGGALVDLTTISLPPSSYWLASSDDTASRIEDLTGPNPGTPINGPVFVADVP